MRLSELVLVRAGDLEPGQRVRFPRDRARELQTVVSVDEDDCGTFRIRTDVGTYVCRDSDLIDTQEIAEVMP